MSDFSDYSYLTPPADPAEFDAWLLAQEERIARKTRAALVKIIDEATEQFINSLTATGDMSAFDQVPIKWGTYVDDVLLEDVQGLFLSGGLSAYVTSPSTAIITESMADAWVNVVNKSAVDYALEASNRMKDVGQTAWNDIKNKVSKSVESGTSTDQLRELLMENRRFSEYRAETIARTETANAYNNGDWAGQQALGEYGPSHKYWVNTADARTRETHVAAPSANGAIPVSQPFIVGGEEMMFPHSPGASAKNVVNCRCRALYLYPGDIDPFTGEVIGDVPTQQVTTAVNETEQTQTVMVQGFQKGPNATGKFSDLIKVPKAQRGRLAERATAMEDTIKILDDIHGAQSTSLPIDLVLGGKSARKGGHFSPLTRGVKPKRVAGESYSEYLDKYNEYLARSMRSEIRVNDQEIAKQMNTMTHEVGHSVDWDGKTFRSRSAWASAEMQSLKRKYSSDWLNHIDEIADDEIRLFAELGRVARDAESVKNLIKMESADYRLYFTSIEEVWARAYAQWVAEVSNDPRLQSIMARKKGGYQFTDEEFKQIRPIIEQILRVRGIIA